MKMYVAGLLLSFFLITGCASGGNNKPENEKRKAAEANTSLGMQYMERGQYEVAFGKLKKAVAEDPGYAPGQTVLAILYERLGEDELAGKHYEKAYEADPKNGDVNNNYGAYLCQKGKTREAIGHFEKALEDPFYSTPAVAMVNAGTCELEAGNLADAELLLREALKRQPANPDGLLAMAKLTYINDSYMTSRAFMQRYESTTSHSANSLLLAFNIEMALKDREASDRYLYQLQTDHADSKQAEEARRLSEK
jgi:type IV pilus assembly protein PilF